MLRIPVKTRQIFFNKVHTRPNSSSSFIRSTFIDYFKDGHSHKHVKSSSVVPLCDPSVPFVNAGMNQFKGVFLGCVQPPCLRAVNSQKCVRVGGKHNDLDVVGTDGNHHTFFEMLGNWSFGDYYKEEACRMAWDLLTGPFRLKPEQLVVTYFMGDAVIGIPEDKECREIWKKIGVASSRLQALGAKDNFWEMGATGPCGPCTEIHYVNPDGSLTEIWNIVFIQCNRESDGSVSSLRTQYVDTGMGLERMASLLQGAPSNYDTDLFRPIIRAIQQKSKGVPSYGGSFAADAFVDIAYRRLADHARMISVCLADGAFPATSLNLKQIIRKSLRTSADVFQCPTGMLTHLYDVVAESLGPTYPELAANSRAAKLVLAHEEAAYWKFKADLAKQWTGLVQDYPEVAALEDLELAWLALGYREFKEKMANQQSKTMPGELMFKLYGTFGFQEDVIDRIAQLNGCDVDKETFRSLLAQYKSRHKTVIQEQGNNRGLQFDAAVEKLANTGLTSTNDQFKYDYAVENKNITYKPLRTKLVAILNQDGEWIDCLEASENMPYYLVTKDTNFYCEEGGQAADSGVIEINENIKFKVHKVFKVKDFVFHKGNFVMNVSCDNSYVKLDSNVLLAIDSDKRLKTMRNHTAIHLLNAAMRKVLPNSVVCQIGSSVTDTGLVLKLTVYGEKLSQKVVNDAQDLVRHCIQTDSPVVTSTLDSVQLSLEDSVLTVPGERYPEVGLRLVHTAPGDVISKELCCGTHVPSLSFIQDFCITLVKGAGGNTPAVHALTADRAKQARELFCRAEKLEQVLHLIDPERMRFEAKDIRQQLSGIIGASGAPFGEYAACLALLETLQKQAKSGGDLSLDTIIEAEIRSAKEQLVANNDRFLVHFLRCSYLSREPAVRRALSVADCTALVIACAEGQLHAAATVPNGLVSQEFTAEKWMRAILPVFDTTLAPPQPGDSPLTYAEMQCKKVSLITCEQLVQEAIKIATDFAERHSQRSEGGDAHHKSRSSN